MRNVTGIMNTDRSVWVDFQSDVINGCSPAKDCVFSSRLGFVPLIQPSMSGYHARSEINLTGFRGK